MRSKLNLFLISIILSFMYSCKKTTSPEPEESIWKTLAPLPAPRVGLVCGYSGGRIYAIGGENSSGYLNLNEEYDPSTDTWTQKTPSPTPRKVPAVAVVNSIIYIIGGINNTGYLNSNEAYDPATDSWKNLTPMPTPRGTPAAGAVGNKIYVIGGRLSNGEVTDINECYNIQTDSWEVKKSMPTPRKGLVIGVVNGKIYAIGGTELYEFPSDKNEVYDPQKDEWSVMTPMPTPRDVPGISSAGVFKNYIVVAGGWDRVSYYYRKVEIYDTNSDKWLNIEDMPTKRRGMGVAYSPDGKIYMIGGFDGNHYRAENEVLLIYKKF